MHKLVTMSDPERQRLIDDFLYEAFGGLDGQPGSGGAAGDHEAGTS